MGKTYGLLKRDGKSFNCCESTLENVNNEHPLPGLDTNVRRAASSFGGGIYWGSICGAPAGMAMAMGLVHGVEGDESLEEFQEKKKFCNDLSKSLMREFEEEFGSINCNELLDVDWRTEEGMARLRELRDTKGIAMCDGYVDWATKKVLETLEG